MFQSKIAQSAWPGGPSTTDHENRHKEHNLKYSTPLSWAHSMKWLNTVFNTQAVPETTFTHYCCAKTWGWISVRWIRPFLAFWIECMPHNVQLYTHFWRVSSSFHTHTHTHLSVYRNNIERRFPFHFGQIPLVSCSMSFLHPIFPQCSCNSFLWLPNRMVPKYVCCVVCRSNMWTNNVVRGIPPSVTRTRKSVACSHSI